MGILSVLAEGGLITVAIIAGLALGFARVFEWPKLYSRVIFGAAVATIPLSQLLPATSAFRQQIGQSIGAFIFLAALSVPVFLYFWLIRRLRNRADEAAPKTPPRQGLGLIEEDDALNADMHARLQAFNSEVAGITRDTFSVVYRDTSGEIVASVRVALLGAQAELRTLWVSPEVRREGIGSVIVRAAEQEARSRGAELIVLNTFSWQTPTFYEQMGFERRYTRAVPGAGEQHFYEKAL